MDIVTITQVVKECVGIIKRVLAPEDQSIAAAMIPLGIDLSENTSNPISLAAQSMERFQRPDGGEEITMAKIAAALQRSVKDRASAWHRVVLGGFALEIGREIPAYTAREINNFLKEYGATAGNITNSISGAIYHHKIRQTREGQITKYTLTTEGRQYATDYIRTHE